MATLPHDVVRERFQHRSPSSRHHCPHGHRQRSGGPRPGAGSRRLRLERKGLRITYVIHRHSRPFGH
eukprot:10074151-Heterocapsa_arctica.AAC.1